MTKSLAILALTLSLSACSADPALDGGYTAFYTQEDSPAPRCQALPNEPLLLTDTVVLPDLGGACEPTAWDDDGEVVHEVLTCRIGNAYVETITGDISRLGDGVLSWDFLLDYRYAVGEPSLICQGFYTAKLVPID